MLLKRLELTNFKNIEHAVLDFSPNVNCFTGNNGMGKSNMLDAIHLLSFCRSFTGVTDKMLVRRGETFMMVRGDYERLGIDEELLLGMNEGRRKTFKRGGKEYSRLTEHIGLFPLVMIAPADIYLIRGTGEERRRWMDMMASQGDAVYLEALVRYNAGLTQRNRLLREGHADRTLLEVIELGLERSAEVIVDRRRALLERLVPVLRSHYAEIAGGGEEPELCYETSLEVGGPGLMELFDANRERDRALGHTTVGPHRDDIAMTLDGMAMRRTASQGQCKTFTIALRLAQYDLLSSRVGMRPLLLLDDVFDRLDATRVERIMEIVSGERFGQIFITDTNRGHLDSIIRRTGGEHRLWTVAGGAFTRL